MILVLVINVVPQIKFAVLTFHESYSKELLDVGRLFEQHFSWYSTNYKFPDSRVDYKIL